MNTEFDAITGRKYINGDSINYNSSVVATYKGEARFLQDDGTLVKINQVPSLVSDNMLTYYLGNSHAQIKLECKSCDNGDSHSLYYDLNGGVSNSTLPFNGAETEFTLIIFLDDNQANKVFRTILEISELSKNGEYKYIYLFHNCVAFFSDVWNMSNLSSYPFTNLLTDTELFQDSPDDIGKNAFTYKERPLHELHEIRNNLDFL